MQPFKPFSPLFCIVEEKISDKSGKHYEGMFTQGSGYMHLRGSYEEGLSCAPQHEEYMRLPANVTVETPRHPRSKFGLYVPGVTGLHPLLREEIANLPYMPKLNVELCGESLDMDDCDIKNYRRYLDMRDGVLYRSFDWCHDEIVLHCEYRRYISKHTENLVVIEAEFTANKKSTITLTSCIDTAVRTNGFNHFKSVKSLEDVCFVGVELLTDTGIAVNMASVLYANCEAVSTKDEKSVCTLELNPNETVKILKLANVSCSRDKKPKNFNELCEDLNNIYADGERYNRHAELWKKMWEDGKVEIEGDDEAQLAVNFSLYHLLRSANASDSRVAVCAKGFAGEAYFGHFFWDTEVYLLPYFLYTNPKTAKSLTEFRINTLEGAKQNAKLLGYDGAKYAWESSVTGEEQCPNWQYCDHEIHINSDVVFGLYHYFKATNDIEFLKKSLPVFVETTKYWLGRMSFCEDGVHINGVMGPDEYICFCDDNAYTNVMVKRAFEYTKEAVSLCGGNENVFTEKELQLIDKAIDKLAVHYDEDGVLLQCHGFDEYEEVDFDKVWCDRSKPFGGVVSQEKNYRTKALKQADALMLSYLFPSSYSKDETSKIFDKYFPFTTHDSSLSYIVHSIVKARLGETKTAYDLFKNSLSIDLDGGAAEGIHIANCGGIWQGVVFGFAGLMPCYEQTEKNIPTFTPNLPKHWKSLKFPLYYGGLKYNVEIRDGEVLCKPI